MKFNNTFLIHENENLNKLIVFAMQENINLMKFMDADREATETIVRKLAQEDLIAVIKTDENKTVYKLKAPMYVEDEIEEIDINKFRNYFTQSYLGISDRLGNKRMDIKLIENFLLENPSVTYEQILEATKNYIVYHIQNGSKQYIAKSSKFIQDETGRSRLKEFIENPIQLI